MTQNSKPEKVKKKESVFSDSLNVVGIYTVLKMYKRVSQSCQCKILRNLVNK